jgi:hypothetical protein
MKYLSVMALVAALALVPSVQAVPTEDCEKTAEELRLDSQLVTKFSNLHSKASSSYGGGYNEARYILERAIRDSQYGSAYTAAEDLERALRSAERECQGTADKFVRMLKVLSRAADGIFNANDKLAVLRGGINFLTQNNPTMMTRDILLLGLSMTAPSLSNYSVAAGILDVILAEARVEATNDNKKEWQSLLSFAVTASDGLYHFQSKYSLQSRVARALVDARPNEAVYLKAMALVAAMELNNAFDQANIIELGLKKYGETVPFENHREVARYLVGAGQLIYNSGAKVSMFRTVMSNLVGLDTKTPAAKVVLRAGLQVSTCRALSASDAYSVAALAANHALKLSCPPFISDTLQRGLREARNTYNSDTQLRIMRDCLQRAIR